MKTALLVALGLTLATAAGCPRDPGGQGVRPDADERRACLAQGGRYEQAGLAARFQCLRPTPDAGEACRRASDCAGFCLADTRTCSVETPLFGCFEYLTETGETVGLCID